jgi:hypothetical protein
MLKNTAIFEKIKIEWFSAEDLKNRKHEFRPFYQEIVDKLLDDLPNIEKFIKSRKIKGTSTTNNKTQKINKI